VHKLQFLPSTGEPIGVDKAAAHGPGVEDHVSGDAHQDIPIISSVGETTHCNTEKWKKEKVFVKIMINPVLHTCFYHISTELNA